jgi:hypothetical protein
VRPLAAFVGEAVELDRVGADLFKLVCAEEGGAPVVFRVCVASLVAPCSHAGTQRRQLRRRRAAGSTRERTQKRVPGPVTSPTTSVE